jgi:molecular chaperone DnaK
VRLINEPAAAALVHAFKNTRKDNRFVAVYNLGGGYFSTAGSGPKHLETILTRRKYEELTGELLERTIRLCTRCLADAQVKPEEAFLCYSSSEYVEICSWLGSSPY